MRRADMCRVEGGDLPQAYSTKDHTARKRHRCGECHRTIEPGERYRYTWLLYEGTPCQYKTCIHCQVGCEWLRINCGGWVFEEVGDELVEHAREYPLLAMPLLRVVIGIRRGWRYRDGKSMALPKLP